MPAPLRQLSLWEEPEPPAQPFTILSGGQTGVDRAALDVALELGLPCGGFCPRGRRAEDGQLPARYPLQETASTGYPERTRLNVRHSDATLVLLSGPPGKGVTLTIDLANRQGKPLMVVNLDEPDAAAVRAWLDEQGIRTLNVAGSRASRNPGVYTGALNFLRAVLRPPLT
ncbi:MAG: putative molybdenum carrier protein [Magnetococcales bacterium]|nr:putative molybdenum carrier protein [Magnetococcales bacterium]